MRERDEYRTFAVPNIPLATFTTDDQVEAPTFRAITLRMPRWATDQMIGRIISAITKWRYAYLSTGDLVVWVPRSWLTQDELDRGLGAGPGSILGVPMLYGPVTEVIVGVRA